MEDKQVIIYILHVCWQDGDSHAHASFLSAHATKDLAQRAAQIHFANNPTRVLAYCDGGINRTGQIGHGHPVDLDLGANDYVIEPVPLDGAIGLLRAEPVGGVAGVPLSGADTLLTWIKSLVEAAEDFEGSHLHGPHEALVLARQLGWGNGKIGQLPALVSTEKQEPKSVTLMTPAESRMQQTAAIGEMRVTSVGELSMQEMQRQGELRRLQQREAEVAAEPDPLRQSFLYELQQLINKHSLENRSNTPDFVLASLLESVLKTWELHTVERDRWYGNRSLLGPGSDWSQMVPTSEKSLLPGIDIVKPRPLIEEARGLSVGPSNYTFKAFDSVEAQPTMVPLDFATGLLGAVNNLYSFHDKMEIPWITDEPTWPGKKRMDLRRELVREECFFELGNALEHLETFLSQRGLADDGAGPVTQGDVAPGGKGEFRARMVAVADGIIDSIYVLIGMGGEMGLDLAEVWRRVHLANMAKAGGPVREDGKRLKPEGWVPPDVEGAIFKDKVGS